MTQFLENELNWSQCPMSGYIWVSGRKTPSLLGVLGGALQQSGTRVGTTTWQTEILSFCLSYHHLETSLRQDSETLQKISLNTASAPMADFLMAQRLRDITTKCDTSKAQNDPIIISAFTLGSNLTSISPTRLDSHSSQSCGLLSWRICHHQLKYILSFLHCR
jgi:hypothetical protein